MKPKGAPYFTPSSGKEPAGTIMPPADATTLARMDLKVMEKIIKTALNNSAIDVISRAHLEESLARITATLNAEVQRHM